MTTTHPHQTSKIFIIGGTGAQGIPVIKGLVSDNKYSVLILTRDLNSTRAKELRTLPNTSFLEGSFASEATLLQGFSQCDGAFINIDGFNCGEKEEIYWAIRSYELAVQSEKIKFFVYGNLDFGYKKAGYVERFRTGHYDGKGRIGEWILQQNRDNNGMGAALFTTGPYIEMTISKQTLMTPTIENGVVTWRVPLDNGAVVHVALDDCGYYVRWLFDNPSRSNGLDLEVGIAHIPYRELAEAFTKVTGHPAQYIPVTVEEYWSSGGMGRAANAPAAYNARDGASMKENFTGFWNLWRASGGNSEKAVIKRDYKFLDEIFPGRIKSAEMWFRRENEKGIRAGLGTLWDRVQEENLGHVLKLSEDGRRGKL